MSTIKYGRISVYGEYLMHSNESFGLLVPSKKYLISSSNYLCAPRYNYTKDRVFKYYNEKYNMKPLMLQGDLPFGYGFASSSILSFMYASNLSDLANLKNEIINTDRLIHSMEPSGIDIDFCLHQKIGLYSALRTIFDIHVEHLNYSIFLPIKEGSMSLKSIQKKILSNLNKLSDCAGLLNKGVVDNNLLLYDDLYEYSEHLVSMNIYSEFQQQFISELLASGYIAKAIGGLYDKAIILIHRQDEDYKKLIFIINKLIAKTGVRYLYSTDKVMSKNF